MTNTTTDTKWAINSLYYALISIFYLLFSTLVDWEIEREREREWETGCSLYLLFCPPAFHKSAPLPVGILVSRFFETFQFWCFIVFKPTSSLKSHFSLVSCKTIFSNFCIWTQFKTCRKSNIREKNGFYFLIHLKELLITFLFHG